MVTLTFKLKLFLNKRINTIIINYSLHLFKTYYMQLFLLQADTSISKAAPQMQSLWDILIKGGVLMIPLAILFVAAVFFFIERLIAIRKAGKIEDNFMSIIRDHIITGNVAAARSLSKNTSHPVARMIDKGIQRIGKPIDAIEKSMENVGVLEMYKMEKNLSIISIIARIAPLFGFLGTIIGMLQLFKGIAASSEYTAKYYCRWYLYKNDHICHWFNHWYISLYRSQLSCSPDKQGRK